MQGHSESIQGPLENIQGPFENIQCSSEKMQGSSENMQDPLRTYGVQNWVPNLGPPYYGPQIGPMVWAMHQAKMPGPWAQIWTNGGPWAGPGRDPYWAPWGPMGS